MAPSKARRNWTKGFEMFGRSFLLPVSVLPAAGILQGLGSAFTNADTIKMYPWMQNQVFQFVMGFLSKMGSAAFNNLPLIFAVGVAVGLAKHEKVQPQFQVYWAFNTPYDIKFPSFYNRPIG